MASVVDLSGAPVDRMIPSDSTPEAVLEKLLCDIRAGALSPTRLLIVGQGDDAAARYFQRFSQMNHFEAIALATINLRMCVDEVLAPP